jgi:hypothetical protein
VLHYSSHRRKVGSAVFDRVSQYVQSVDNDRTDQQTLLLLPLSGPAQNHPIMALSRRPLMLNL